MSNIDKHALTAESARESGNILLIVAARMTRRELFTPLHYVSELPQKVVSMRVFREALERSEETLQREVCKIVDGHDRLQKKLKEAEAKLEAAERERDNWRTSFDNERFRADKLAEAFKTEHEQLVMANGALITQHMRANGAEKRVAELEASHSNLREAMAGIHNTITGGGAYTPLAAILNASKLAYEESAAAAGKGE